MDIRVAVITLTSFKFWQKTWFCNNNSNVSWPR